MKFTSEQDVIGLAKDLELAARLLRASGLRALRTTEAWKLGPKSANLDPDAGGWRWETIIEGNTERVVPIPADATGETVLALLDGDRIGVLNAQLAASLTFLADASDRAIRIIRIACPDRAALSLVADELTDVQVSAEGWCISCWRDGGYCEPVAVRPNGQRRYRDFCHWCGVWNGVHGKQPPLRLVELRHEGKKLTDREVRAVLAAEDAERKEAKKNRKKVKAKG